MRIYRWRIVARDVNGAEIGRLERTIFRRSAQRWAAKWRRRIPEPIPGRPLYTVDAERAK